MKKLYVFDKNDLDDKDKVKKYLQLSFQKRLRKKSMKLYYNICQIFEKYPATIKELLNNIPVLGYYKYYFYILIT